MSLKVRWLLSDINMKKEAGSSPARHYQESFFNKEESVFSCLEGFNWHSQRLMIFQPSFFKGFTTFSSLALLPVILFIHHFVLVLGITKYLQLPCPCQKQP